MRELAFRLLNVFTLPGERLSGNPLAVFEDGSSLSDGEMLALARQLNLSETTFILPASVPGATVHVRIFTPTFEMPFAGHPTLGTAHVVRDLRACGDRVALQMRAGLVEVVAAGDTWTLRAARAPETEVPAASRAELAEMVGLPAQAIASDPLWVDTGAQQLVIPLASPDDVARARPNAELLARRGFSSRRGESMAYVWARRSEREISARFFFLMNGGVIEDPATGSACANLGGYLLGRGQPLPLRVTVLQGEAVARPSRLELQVDAQGSIFVGGGVVELARGRMQI